MMGFLTQHSMPIIGLIILLLTIVVMFQYWGILTNKREKRINKIVTIEGYEEHISPGLFPDSENPQAMCNIHLDNPVIIDKQCKTFSKNNCNTVGCCVWKNETCVGGTDNQPFYYTDI